MEYAVLLFKLIYYLSNNYKKKETGAFIMGTDNNNYKGPERRVEDRRTMADRRGATRFSDTLGRRSGVERRLSVRVTHTHIA